MSGLEMFQIGNAQIENVPGWKCPDWKYQTYSWTAFILLVHDKLSETISSFYTFYTYIIVYRCEYHNVLLCFCQMVMTSIHPIGDTCLIECHQHSHTGNLVFGHGPIYLRRETVLNYGVARDVHVQMSINYL